MNSMNPERVLKLRVRNAQLPIKTAEVSRLIKPVEQLMKKRIEL